MPQPVMVAEHGDELIRVYRQAWVNIQAEQRRVLSDPALWRRRLRLAEMRQRIEFELAQVDVEMREWLMREYPLVYRQGAIDGARAASAAFESWTQLHTDAVSQLARDTFDDLLEATRFVRADTKRFIREAAKIASELTTTTGRTAVQGGKSLEDVLARRGITSVVYRNGSRHGLDEYAQMVIRTKTAVGYNIGALNAGFEQGGVVWYEVFDGPGCGWTAHDVGEIALGKIVTRDECLAYPISHPNCRRSFGARPDVTSRAAARDAKRSVTPEQIEDQRAADKARRAAQSRRRGRRNRRTRRPVRTQTT